MPETLTEINRAETERRVQAMRYEDATNAKIKAEVNIKRLEPLAAKYKRQLATVDRMFKTAEDLEPVDVTFTNLANTVQGKLDALVRGLLTDARATLVARLKHAEEDLASARANLQAAEQTISALR